jgi:DNA repair exonuclease SbcCD nuclease subunit
MVRILHFSDLHLDASFAGMGLPAKVARQYREELRQCLKRILQIARERHVTAITIAGDLYEQERFSPDTGQFLVESFASIAPIRVFIAPGNHDPWTADSLYRYLSWPKNVHFFTRREFEKVELESGIFLWGIAHLSPSEREAPLTRFRIPEEGTHVLLFHGSDTTSLPEGKQPHAPFKPEEVQNAGARLALVGHYHGPYTRKVGDTTVIYPGSPEPLGFGETGSHGVTLVEINGNNVVVEQVALSRYRFVQGKVDVSGLSTRDAIRGVVRQWSGENGGERTFLRLVLVGELHPDVEIDTEVLADVVMEHALHGQVVDRTRPGYSLEELREEQTLRGAFVRALLDEAKGETEDQQAKFRRALLYGLRALDGREILLPK